MINVSFSSQVKDELAKNLSGGRHCHIAELAAIISLCGKISISYDEKYSITVTTENKAVAEKYYGLLRKTFSILPEVSVRKNILIKNIRVYSVNVLDHDVALLILQATKFIHKSNFDSYEAYSNIYENLSSVDNVILQQICCKRAFLRGSFLAAGSISDPKKTYHFEIVCPNNEKAEQLKKIINSFNLDAKIVLRKKYYVVYLKEGSMIVDALNIMEAHVSLMELENVRIIKDVRNAVNRRVNCETANINKTVSAAVKQLEDINIIKEKVGLSKLSDGLEEIAIMRLNNPDATLKELGMMLNPPVGKSGVNHRLRKLSILAEDIREKTI